MKLFNEAHVLILNHSTTTAENIKKLLCLLGFKEHKVYTCYSPEAALGAYYPVKFDLVISEHIFPQSRLTSVEVVAEVRDKGMVCRNATFVVISDTPVPELGFTSDIDEVVVLAGTESKHLPEVVKRIRQAFLSRQKMRPLGLASEAEPLGDLLHKCNEVEIKYPELFYPIQKYRGSFFSAHGMHNVTVNLYRSMIDRMDKDMDGSWLYDVLITALINDGQTEEAEKTFQSIARERDALPSWLLEAEAQILLSKQDILGAIDKYETLAQQMPLDVARLRLLGHMYLFTKRFDKCLESYLHAVQLSEGMNRTKLENQLLYIRALLYVRSECHDTQVAYQKKFELEVNKIGKRKYTLEDKIRLSIIELHAMIFNGKLSVALQKIKEIMPIIDKVDSLTKAHFLSILDALMLEKEFAYVYKQVNDEASCSTSDIDKSIKEHLIEQCYREHQYRRTESRKIATRIDQELESGALARACNVCVSGYKMYPYSERIGRHFLTILLRTQPENMGNKQVKELVVSLGKNMLPFFSKESKERTEVELNLKLALDRYC